MVGTLASGLVANQLGCRWTLRISCLLLLGGWGFIALADGVTTVLLGRFLQGIT